MAPTQHEVILIADDNEDDLFFFRRNLQRAGVRERPLCFSDGSALVDYIARHYTAAVRYVVFVDMHMPKMDGAEVLAWIRGNPRLAALDVVLVTGSSNPADIARVAALGVRHCLAKPPCPEALARLIASRQRQVEGREGQESLPRQTSDRSSVAATAGDSGATT